MTAKPITENTLFYGDNLIILREHIPNESVDFIYLDPPFYSSQNYNVFFKDEHGTDSEAQIEAFEDTLHRNMETEEPPCTGSEPAYLMLIQYRKENATSRGYVTKTIYYLYYT